MRVTGYRDEIVTVAGELLELLASQRTAETGPARSGLARACSRVRAYLGPIVRSGSLPEAVGACFAFVLPAGVPYQGIAQVRRAALARETRHEEGRAVCHLFVRLCLIHEAAQVARLNLRSRSEAEELIAYFTEAFASAIDVAADDGQGDVYRTLQQVHAAATRRLIELGRPLPEVIRYALPKPMPSLVAAHRLYGDASRHEELINENKVRHPAFMPREGRAFSR